MTSRPGPGITESLHHRGRGGLPQSQVRRPPPTSSGSQHHGLQQDCIDPSLDADRSPVEETMNKSRTPAIPKARPPPLETIHTTSDSVRPPPRGKPQLFFNHASTDNAQLPLLSPRSQPAANLPVPPRPISAMPGESTQIQRKTPGGTGVKGDPGAEAPHLDNSSPAVFLPGGKPADVFPWNGNNPEDTLSEALVKGGVGGKTQTNNTESNTARPSLWSNLKNKSGPSTLSSLFVAVLEKRQACGRVTASHTFKPPPRLTLRESARETWLHDLANPAVGLRRLSRTIPHSLTGKGLLDQCLNKKIPIQRALWLAKCVGINEMRAHKRKGQAGTISWVKGWTISVEQFLDNNIAAIGHDHWKSRITYALQLATHLFKEHLLEDDHYLDWILRNLDSSAPEHLFVWLLFVSMSDHWTSLTCVRRRGKRLAESLLARLEKLYQVVEEWQSSPVLTLLENTVIKMIMNKPACILLPRTWQSHDASLQTLIERRNYPQLTQALENLNIRNRRLIFPRKTISNMSSTAHVYRLLDALDYGNSIHLEDLALGCMEHVDDAHKLVHTVLQWASSRHREGVHRIFLVSRLLRRWHHLGVDAHGCILTYLQSSVFNGTQDKWISFRIIAELVRSKIFSVGRYLQWLIATGSSLNAKDTSSVMSWRLRLITEIPLSPLSNQVRNLRGTLLRGTAFSVEEENRKINGFQHSISQQLLSPCEIENENMTSNLSDFGDLCHSIRLELGSWLRQQVAASLEMVEHVPTKDTSVYESGCVCKMTLESFHIVRTYLEEFKDLTILADVIDMVASSLDTNVLASVADTLQYNLRAFRAIGAFDTLFEKISMRYAVLRTIRFPERDLLLSLLSLARTTRADDQLVQILHYDLARSDQKHALAACSPVSDNMTEVTQTTAADTDNEIERILSSGTSMDQSVMMRVFEKITHHVTDQSDRVCHHFESHSSWFHRLRTFDRNAFDNIMSEWLTSRLMTHQMHTLRQILPLLPALDCIVLPCFIKSIMGYMAQQGEHKPEEAIQVAIEGLKSIVPSKHLNAFCSVSDAYRYRVEQQNVCTDPRSGVLGIVREIVITSATHNSLSVSAKVAEFLSTDQILAFLKYHVIHDKRNFTTALALDQQSSKTTNWPLKSLFNNMLDTTGRLGLSKQPLDQQVARVIESADTLSLPFSQLVIQQISLVECESALLTKHALNAFLGAIKVAVDKDQAPWSDLFMGLEKSLRMKIRQYAEREILNTSSFLCSTASPELKDFYQGGSAFIQKYLSLMDLAPGALTDEQPEAFSALADRFKGMVETLNRYQDTLQKGTQTVDSTELPTLLLWHEALLHITIDHCSVTPSFGANQHFLPLLQTLMLLMKLESQPSIAQKTFDAVMVILDMVPEDTRNQVVRCGVIQTVDDPCATFMFGSGLRPDGWLFLTTPAPVTTNSPSVFSSQMQSHQIPHGPPHTQPTSRSSSQHHINPPNQHKVTAHTQLHQPSTPSPKFQRISSGGGHTTQLAQFQHSQQQQTERLSPVSSQRQFVGSQPFSLSSGKPGPGFGRSEKPELKIQPLFYSKWEILPDSGGTSIGNETALSLSLFGARRM